jgi:hypothetical protein
MTHITMAQPPRPQTSTPQKPATQKRANHKRWTALKKLALAVASALLGACPLHLELCSSQERRWL